MLSLQIISKMENKVKNKILIIALFAVTLFGSNMVIYAANTVAEQPVAKKTLNTLSKRTNELESKVSLLKKQIGQMQGNKSSDYQFKSLVEMYAHGPAVVTSPAFGVHRFSGIAEDLMVNRSSVNADMSFLLLRKKMDNYAISHGIPIPQQPVIALSGSVEGKVTYNNNHKYSTTSEMDVNLSRAELDIVGEATPWATGVIIISYEDASSVYNRNITRVSNSRLKLDRGFLTIGQLNKCPVYLTMGQVYAPFGSYSSFMITKPSTKVLGRVKDRMIIVGYNKAGFSAQIYGLAGETQSKHNEVVRHGGVDLGYNYARNNFAMNIGAGVLGNLAESEGMQDIFGAQIDTSSDTIKPKARETIASSVQGINGHVKLKFYDQYVILAEYVGASKAFSQSDFSFNGEGARPQAVHVGASFGFDSIAQKPSTLFAGYGFTSQALVLNVPKQNFSAGYTISPIKNTLASIEYRHNINYDYNDTAGAGDRAVNVKKSVTGGRHANIVTVQLGVYF